MLQEYFSSNVLNILYAVAVFASSVYALIIFLGAGVSDAFDFDADIDADGDVDFLSISPFALAMFGAAFGLSGLITRTGFDMDAAPSLAWATISGLLVGVLAQVLFLYVFSPSKSSHYSLVDDAVGRLAEVIITIPNDGLGTIAFDNVSGRVTLGARSAAGKQIAKGETVRIAKITGRVAVVRPADAHDWTEFGESAGLKLKQ